MRIRYSPTSPYVRIVMAVAYEKGIEDRIERIATDVWAPDTDIGNDNPLGKVPALLLDDGTVLYDSRVIAEYLDSLAETPRLFPAPGPARWESLRQLALAVGVLDAAVLRLVESRRPPEQQSEAWSKRQAAAIRRALDRMEADAPGLAGSPAIHHLAIGSALGYLDFRFAADDWRAGHPRLAAWYEEFSARPAMAATVPKDPA